MRYPSFLKAGSKIGLVAPSFGCTTEPYKSCLQSAIYKLRLLGFEIEKGENCDKSDGIGISTDPVSCGKELNYFFCDSDCAAVLSCGGGELMCESIENADFNAIAKAEPKWFMGYSDNTNLTFLLPTLCDTASIYGINAPAFGISKWHKSHLDTLGVLKGEIREIHGYDSWELSSLKTAEDPLAPYNLTEVRKSFSDKGDVSFRGRMLGGCTDCLASLTGTRFDKVKAFNEKYASDGVIWFLESCDLNVFAVRRALWQMKNAGWFDTAKGFIIGRPRNFGEELMGLDHYEAVKGAVGDIAPIIFDVDIGHLPPSMPIVTGSVATVSLCGNDVKIEYEMI